jgi:hypothetical protein
LENEVFILKNQIIKFGNEVVILKIVSAIIHFPLSLDMSHAHTASTTPFDPS